MATVVKPTQLSCLHNVEATTPIECLPNMLQGEPQNSEKIVR